MCNMAYDKNYARLVQFYTSKASRNDIIKEILRDNAINYQIPVNPNLQGMKLNLAGCTALHVALKVNDFGAFYRLIQNNADFTIKNNNNETVVHAAINMAINNSKSALELEGEFHNRYVTRVLSARATHNFSTNPSNSSRLSHFHAACMTNNVVAVVNFLKKGVSVTETINLDASYLPGYTPLHCAARYRSLEAAKILLDHGGTVHCKDAKGMTPFHLLIERSMEIADWMNMGQRAICNSLKSELKDNDKFIETMLKKYTVDTNSMMNVIDLSYLHIACTLQDTSLVEQELEKIEDLEEAIRTDSVLWPGYTALHFAAHFNITTVKLLIKKGANMLAQDARGITPFNLCSERYKAEEIEFLINNETNWKYIRFSDETFLPILIQAMKSKDMLSSFLEHIMKNVNAVIPDDSPLWPGYTPLHFAVNFAARYREIDEVYSNICHSAELIKEDLEAEEKMYNCDEEEEQLYLERIKLMLESGADVTAQDLQGSTPLHHAFLLQRENVVNLLFQYHSKWPNSNPIDSENLSHLHIACASGNYDVVSELLTECNDVDQTIMFDYKFKKTYYSGAKPASFFFTAGSTPLHIAVIARETDIVRLLVSSGADLYAKDAKGMTPIHRLLAHNFQYQVVEIGKILFLEEDLRDCVTSFGLSHLHVASHVNNVEAIERLLDVGADIKGKVQYEKLSATGDQLVDESEEALSFLNSYYDYTPLDFAIHDYCIEAYVALMHRSCRIIKNPFNTICCVNFNTFLENLVDIGMESLPLKFFGARKLHMACFNFDVDGVRKLLKNGADPNWRIPETSRIWSGLTPLHLLLRQRQNYPLGKRILIAELLIQHGADITLTNFDDVTPLHAVYNVQNSFEFYEKKFADVLLNGHKDLSKNPVDARGISHFHAACVCNKFTMVEGFLQNGTDVNQTVEPFSNVYAGYTPLHFAVHFKSNKTIDLLLKHGANVHAQDCKGNTPLHVAVMCDDYYSRFNENILIKLISAGAKMHVKNLLGQIPFAMIMRISYPKSKGGKNVPPKVLQTFPKCQCFVNIFTYSGWGYIATSIKDEQNIKNIMKNPLYAAVMNAPDVNKYDEMNRTPIHNIVAIRKIKASVKIYIKAIHEFVKLGYDIDHQNAEGETALYYAVKFQNSKAVVALLTLGADINIADNSQDTPISMCLDSIRKNEDKRISILLVIRVLEILWKHVYKLQLANLSLNQTNRNFEGILSQNGDLIKRITIEPCQHELERLRNKKIDPSNVSLFGFLSETSVVASYPNMLLQDRQAVDNLFQNQNFRLHREFPEFAGLLQMHYRKALERLELVESAKSSFEILSESILPDLCCYYVMKFLKNDDLKNLITLEEEIMLPPKKRRKCN